MGGQAEEGEGPGAARVGLPLGSRAGAVRLGGDLQPQHACHAARLIRHQCDLCSGQAALHVSAFRDSRDAFSLNTRL